MRLLCSWFQIQDEKGDVTITNDGATILKQMQVLHPSAKMVRPSLDVGEEAFFVAPECSGFDLWCVCEAAGGAVQSPGHRGWRRNHVCGGDRWSAAGLLQPAAAER